MKILLKRLPAMITVGALYGFYYDVHAAQIGIEGTPEGARMTRVYSYAKQYPNEVEHTYSFVQIITACTASFAHGANDIGNAVSDIRCTLCFRDLLTSRVRSPLGPSSTALGELATLRSRSLKSQCGRSLSWH